MISIQISNEQARLRCSIVWSEEFGEFAGLIEEKPSIMARGATIGEVLDDLLAKESIDFEEIEVGVPDALPSGLCPLASDR